MAGTRPSSERKGSAVLAARLARWASIGLLQVDEPRRTAAAFNSLLLGEAVNRAMSTGDSGLESVADRRTHAAEVVRFFPAAYG